MAENVELQKKLEALKQIYLQQLPDRADEIRRTWKELPTVSNKESTFQTLRNLIHRITGSAGTYGFEDLSHAARTLEYSLEEYDLNHFDPNSQNHERISRAIEELSNMAKSQVNVEVPAAVDTQSSINNENKTTIDQGKEIPLVLFFTMRGQNYTEWKTLFQSYGYEIEIVSDEKEFLDRVKRKQCHAAIVDVISIPDRNQFRNDIQAIDENYRSSLPFIFLASSDDFQTRLYAVHCAAKEFFIHPVDVGDIIDKLDKHIVEEKKDPYRVLIIDDEKEQAMYSQAILEDAGMETQIVTDPMHVMEPLFDFQPDILLMDLYMPECNGFDLSAVIRQVDRFVSIPIVYLSAETRHEKQAAAMKLGGDEFLTKPIKADHLIEVVSQRVERLRILRSFIIRDSLTGLLNHSSIQDSLKTIFHQATRHEQNVVFVLIDIDHFKGVNDTYGHLTGDRVLKRLSRFLKKRLRKADIVGRWGGEEFAIILPNTSKDDAYEVLEEIREGFANIPHPKSTEDDVFHVTLSAGLAERSFHEDPINLTKAADKALYMAKAAGRNRVVISDE